ncbi:acyl carrier protein [Micromonospora yasonensis]|uniref:acyl carrier protein n=1 Tax=Micromonospora yasonensis TaxID=1128667 RepID=UPI00223022DB|nr:acyl carrier protein [Micromonospora yasonensis]MCW3840383.1 acyl carrier protein [Micromonospora yasonensis]
MLTLDDLREIMTTCGVEDGVDLYADITDVPMEDLGYDSLARLQIAALIKDRTAVAIADDKVLELETPRELLDFVNAPVGVA